MVIFKREIVDSFITVVDLLQSGTDLNVSLLSITALSHILESYINQEHILLEKEVF